jgi:hypothetical protein
VPHMLPAIPRRFVWLLVVGLAGCGAGKTIDVTRQSRLSSPVKNAAFIVLLSTDQGGQPEYQEYAATLARQLQAQGLAGVRDPAKARYAVMFDRTWPHKHAESDVSQDSGESMHGGGMGRGGMGGGGMGGGGMGGGGFGGGGGGGGHHHGGGGGLGGDRGDSSDTSVRIALFDLTKPDSPQEKVFFAKVRAPIGQDEDDAAVDTMIEAALKDFPGKRNETFSVALPTKQPGA